MVLPPNRFVTYTNRSDGCTATALGVFPASKGEPDTGVRAPLVELITYAETVPWFSVFALATYAKWPVGSTATLKGCVPAEKGEPGMGVRAPVKALMVYADMLSELMFVT